jgi:hypothetical protein
LPKIAVSWVNLSPPSCIHAVTGVTGEPDDGVIELLDLLGHGWKTSSARPV